MIKYILLLIVLFTNTVHANDAYVELGIQLRSDDAGELAVEAIIPSADFQAKLSLLSSDLFGNLKDDMEAAITVAWTPLQDTAYLTLRGLFLHDPLADNNENLDVGVRLGGRGELGRLKLDVLIDVSILYPDWKVHTYTGFHASLWGPPELPIGIGSDMLLALYRSSGLDVWVGIKNETVKLRIGVYNGYAPLWWNQGPGNATNGSKWAFFAHLTVRTD